MRPGCFQVTVKSGDSLWTICNRLLREGHPPVAAGLIRGVNGLDGDRIYAGQRLKVPSDPISVIVSKSDYQLSMWLGDVMIRRYPVGLGKDDRTPEGDFEIGTRQKEPTWYKPGVGEVPFGDPENVLGTRWLGFRAPGDGFPNANQFGIHGTWEDHSIGGKLLSGLCAYAER